MVGSTRSACGLRCGQQVDCGAGSRFIREARCNNGDMKTLRKNVRKSVIFTAHCCSSMSDRLRRQRQTVALRHCMESCRFVFRLVVCSNSREFQYTFLLHFTRRKRIFRPPTCCATNTSHTTPKFIVVCATTVQPYGAALAGAIQCPLSINPAAAKEIKTKPHVEESFCQDSSRERCFQGGQDTCCQSRARAPAMTF